MPFLQVSSCCCGCSLETGTKIIASIGIIVNILHFFNVETAIPAEIIISDLVFAAIGVLINSILLYGAIKRHPDYVLPWLVLAGISLVLAAVAIPILIGLAIYWHGLVKDITYYSSEHLGFVNAALVTVAIVFIVYFAIFLALGIYFFAVVLSFYRELKADQEVGPGYNMSPVTPVNIVEESNKIKADGPTSYPNAPIYA